MKPAFLLTTYHASDPPHVAKPTANKPPVPPATTNSRTVADSSLSEPSPVRGGQGRDADDVSADALIFGVMGALLGVVGACILIYVLTR